jgi:hypothetical protein
MMVVAFIEPPQPNVIEAILKHSSLRLSRSATAPTEVNEWVKEPDVALPTPRSNPPTRPDQSHMK